MPKSPMSREDCNRKEEQETASTRFSRRLREDLQFRRPVMEWKLGECAGKELREWRSPFLSDRVKTTQPPLPPFNYKIYPFSDQKAIFDRFVSDLYHLMSHSTFLIFAHEWCNPKDLKNRVQRAYDYFVRGTTWFQCAILAPVVLLFELLMPLMWAFFFILALLGRVILETGVVFPILSIVWNLSFGSGLYGIESLPEGENGYTKVFRGGDDVDLDDLEQELMARNEHAHNEHTGAKANTICISYKHYANSGIIAGDDHRICRTDLQAIASLIKASGPCKVRFWIDAKLPATSDDTFEKWIDRGVRPYGRYITFLCPSAQRHAETSFWLSNEYHFAAAAKGAMYFKGDEIYYEIRYGCQLHLHRRFLHILIGAERHPVEVRDQDRGKVVNWAMCCLHAKERGWESSLSPNIDNLDMLGEFPYHAFMSTITNVVRKFGEQELPVISGQSWNKDNPLVLAGIRGQKYDMSEWCGLCLDGSPETIYFVYDNIVLNLHYETKIVLEVKLDKAHSSKEKIRVVRKVLREVGSSFLLRCKFVTLPWLCDWE